MGLSNVFEPNLSLILRARLSMTAVGAGVLLGSGVELGVSCGAMVGDTSRFVGEGATNCTFDYR